MPKKQAAAPSIIDAIATLRASDLPEDLLDALETALTGLYNGFAIAAENATVADEDGFEEEVVPVRSGKVSKPRYQPEPDEEEEEENFDQEEEEELEEPEEEEELEEEELEEEEEPEEEEESGEWTWEYIIGLNDEQLKQTYKDISGAKRVSLDRNEMRAYIAESQDVEIPKPKKPAAAQKPATRVAVAPPPQRGRVAVTQRTTSVKPTTRH